MCTGRQRVVHSKRCSRRVICSAVAACPQPSHTKVIEFVMIGKIL